MDKKLVVYLVAYPLYWIGCFFSFVMDGFGYAKVYGAWPTHLLYKPYNWCMVKSCEIEDLAGTEIIWGPMPRVKRESNRP